MSRTKWFKRSKPSRPEALDRDSERTTSQPFSRLVQLFFAGVVDRRGKQLGRAAQALDGLGADRFLFAAIGSWGDTLTDEQVLQDLHERDAAPWEVSPAHRRTRS